MSLINVGICGASGKMGKALIRAVVNKNKLQIYHLHTIIINLISQELLNMKQMLMLAKILEL